MSRPAMVPRSVALTPAQVARVRALYGDRRVLSRLVRRGLELVLADDEEQARQKAANMLQDKQEGTP